MQAPRGRELAHGRDVHQRQGPVEEGELEFTIGSNKVTVGAGDFIYAPGGTLHGFRGISDEAARVVIFDAPAHAESFFKEVDREVKGPDDIGKVPRIGLRHGIRFASQGA
jgi:uncharacterized RmlC-like cupin family protein